MTMIIQTLLIKTLACDYMKLFLIPSTRLSNLVITSGFSAPVGTTMGRFTC